MAKQCAFFYAPRMVIPCNKYNYLNWQIFGRYVNSITFSWKVDSRNLLQMYNFEGKGSPAADFLLKP